MTHDILQSDIDLARRLLDERRPATEIVAVLGYRGIDASRATQLLAELETGKKVEPDKPISINLPSNRIEETTEQPPGHGSPGAERPRERSKSQKAARFPWFTIIALTSAAVCVVAFVLVSRRSHATNSMERANGAGDTAIADSKPAKLRDSGGVLNAKGISLEVEPEAVRLCGASMTRNEFLAGIFKVLGTPTRTNHLEKAEQIIYAYDEFGLLLYSPKDLGRYAIVLDFDGSEGAAGTKTAFVGSFKINKQVVGPGTDAASLGLIKQLVLQAPKSASGIFRAQYGKSELIFGYLKSPERLSLVEIDFK